jgi:hypothetical protein
MVEAHGRELFAELDKDAAPHVEIKADDPA